MIFIPYFFLFLFGIAVGSFLNAFAFRYKRGKSVLWQRSQCIHCEMTLQASDLIPVVSFIMLKGKCRKCKRLIPRHYFFVEVICGLLFMGALYFSDISLLNGISGGELLLLSRDLFAISILLLIFLIDALYFLIPDVITIPAIIILILFHLFMPPSFLSMFLGALIAGGFFLLQFVISKGRWIGDGDIRFGVLMGVLLGWQKALLALFLSYILGSMVAIVLLLMKKKRFGSKLPFGVFLTPATLIALWVGNDILQWYLHYLYYGV